MENGPLLTKFFIEICVRNLVNPVVDFVLTGYTIVVLALLVF